MSRQYGCLYLYSICLLLLSHPLKAEIELHRHHPSIAEITCFAKQPDIVTPTGIAVSPDGRVFVLENHTHKRKPDYKGPAQDRLLIFEDTDGDGVQDKRTVFFSGMRYTTDLLFVGDDLYATDRSTVYRFKGAAKQEVFRGQPDVIIKCETTGNYPHDGVSGLAINPHDPHDPKESKWLYFGFGENLGHNYTFIGTDGRRFSGGGEGGSTYRCKLDGTQLEKISTGHWNAFGMCFDLRGNLFATDNDPSSTPPNRLLHVMPGADFGYEYRYGRSGMHPLITWTGAFPGTLGMAGALGEAACGVTPFADKQLLVASWGDNRIDLHQLKERGASFIAPRMPFITGPADFRPVHFSFSPDKRFLYISDWVKRDYPVHGHGRIWRVKLKQPANLKPQNIDSRLQAVKLENAMDHLKHEDPYLRARAVHELALHFKLVEKDHRLQPLARDLRGLKTGRERAHFALSLRRTGRKNYQLLIPELLNDREEEVAFVGVKWIADDMLKDYSEDLAAQLKRNRLSSQLALAILAAQQRLNGEKITDRPDHSRLRKLLHDKGKSISLRAMALRLMPREKITTQALIQLSESGKPRLELEAVRSLQQLAEEGNQDVLSQLASIAGDARKPELQRLEAIVGLAHQSQNYVTQLKKLMMEKNPSIKQEASRALVGTGEDGRAFESKPAYGTEQDLDAWVAGLKALPGTADALAGRRLFFHPRLATCSRCHMFNDRGGKVGPDLSSLHKQGGVDQKWLLKHVLRPNDFIAPHFLPWQLTMKDGQVKVAFSLGKQKGQEAYIGADGKTFIPKPGAVTAREELDISMMPPGLLLPLTMSEVRDLLSFILKGH